MNGCKTVEPDLPEGFSQVPTRMLFWYAQNKRDLPWRHTRDPYRILVSEIMLQQTRVEAVLGYYERFLARFPTAAALAAASDDALIKAWEGLGYYSRARNLRRAAAAVAQSGFPRSVEKLRALPGVGAYTAGAVASIAFDIPAAAVDGNLLRIFSRLLHLTAPVGNALQKQCHALVSQILPKENCGDFTQSFMDLGSLVCLPQNPKCAACPLADLCLARKAGDASSLPVRTKKPPRPVQTRTVFVLRKDTRIAVQKRDGGVLRGLWGLPDVEGTLSERQAADVLQAHGVAYVGAVTVREEKHVFTHLEWHMRVYDGEVAGFGDFPARDAGSVPLPTAYRKCLRQNRRQ